MSKLKAKRQEFIDLQSEIQNQENDLRAATSQESNLLQTIAILEKKIEEAQMSLMSQDGKRDRAYKGILRTMKEIRKQRNLDGMTEEEKDLKIRELRDKVSIALTETFRWAEQSIPLEELARQLLVKVHFF
jgi:type II secretory pathway component PulJ